MDDPRPNDAPTPQGGWVGNTWQDGRRHRRARRFPLFGFVLFAWGLVWLGREAGWWSFDDRYLAPIALVVLGVASMMRWGMRSW